PARRRPHAPRRARGGGGAGAHPARGRAQVRRRPPVQLRDGRLRRVPRATRRGRADHGRPQLPLRAREGRGLRAHLHRTPRHVLRRRGRMNSVHATTETVDRSIYPYRMKDLCEATGLPRQAIHFYIQEGLLPPGVKTGRNMAFYGEAHLERLKTIKRLQHERFLPLKAIKALLDDKSHHFDPVQWRFLADVKKSLKAELGDRDVAVETVDVGALAERLGVDLLDVEEAIEQGIVGVREEPDGRRVIAASDVWYFELWAEMRAIGFT